MKTKIIKDKYYGWNLKDKKGNIIKISDTVLFKGEKQKLLYKKFYDNDLHEDINRIIIGNAGLWLIPKTAIQCEKTEQ